MFNVCIHTDFGYGDEYENFKFVTAEAATKFIQTALMAIKDDINTDITVTYKEVSE